jgi:hypothetical protein
MEAMIRKRCYCSVIGLFISLALFGQAQVLPEFTFYRADGRPFGRHDLPVNSPLLFVFFDPDCPHCQQAVRHIGEQSVLNGKTEICLVSVEKWEKIRSFIAVYGVKLKGRSNVVWLRDSVAAFITEFKPLKFPAMMLYSPSGKLVDYEDNENTVFRLVKLMAAAGG